MTKKRRNMKRPRKKQGLTLVGSAQLTGALTSTSSVGAFVATRYEVDTTLVPSWQQAGQLFVRWRIKRLRFEFRGIKGTTTEGNVGIVFLPDPQMTTPNTTASALSNEKSNFGHIYANLNLVVRPKHEGWLFTRDSVLLDDRLEMPGDVVIFTDNTSASYIPGIVMLHYEVEFDEVANSTVAPNPKTRLALKAEGKILDPDGNTVKGAETPEEISAADTTDGNRLSDIPLEVIELAKRLHALKSGKIGFNEVADKHQNQRNSKPSTTVTQDT